MKTRQQRGKRGSLLEVIARESARIKISAYDGAGTTREARWKRKRIERRGASASDPAVEGRRTRQELDPKMQAEGRCPSS